ncbi:TPA: TIR domain-containing protein [Vibrio parahaemolyticus]|nr:toll/interleukin-1 receptor domain-containing protein [Vibrio parahaemolyticus]HAV1379347.1 TIR domain-containing protein [Vibrio parahaemolyticus]HAV1410288.1 TIR domain-containing protein [Vibrio parahaemolyticus]HAV1466878.1 TIR domain-containing protein [Vibrio parahaemolyticus]HAV1530781.1 TIR domain-containing protein [Vibrio parahaemolyticus]
MKLGVKLKVFLSWSGETSHKVALAFREWLPSVIQSIEPYVSSEDIDKGARWSTDIAKELEDSTYGILCVTQENMNAPWLTFEAGALSKTMDKSLVSPFLFDVKRSEVHGPILQFQSTVFDKEDIKKLVVGLNKASEKEVLTDERLNRAFDVWYPTLEKELNELKSVAKKDADTVEQSIGEPVNSEILEEILDLSRVNQKLLRNTDAIKKEDLNTLQASLDELRERVMKRPIGGGIRRKRFDPMFIEDLMHMGHMRRGYTGFLMLLSLFKDDYPWIYEAGTDAVRDLKLAPMNRNVDPREVVMQFEELVAMSLEHPAVRSLTPYSKELRIYSDKLAYLLRDSFEQNS